jgi:acyl-CoA synthetase (AMP-forming)/AMP-acid ligase II
MSSPPRNSAPRAQGTPLRVLYVDKPPRSGAVDPVPATHEAVTDAHATAVLPFSSGTTGLPKGVQHTNRNLVANLLQQDATIAFSKQDVVVNVLPYFHAYGLSLILLGALWRGAT